MSGKDRLEWQAMLQANPKLRTAWDGYLAQLDKDAALIARGTRPTGQALAKAARHVLDTAIPLPAIPAND